MEYRDIDYVKVEKWEGNKVQFRVGLKVYNPNNYKIKIKKVVLDASVNGQDLGQVLTDSKLVLPAEAESVQGVVCKASGSQLFGMMPGLFTGGAVKLHLKGTVKGKVSLFSRTFPVDFEENINVGDLGGFGF